MPQGSMRRAESASRAASWLKPARTTPKIFVSPAAGNDFASNKSYQKVNLYWRFLT
jgi:hypothetical protein